jgi:enolase-phosphatase E1
MPAIAMPRAILIDLEGTITPIAFVRDALFPHARRALPGFLRARGADPEVRRWVDAVAAEIGQQGDDAVLAALLAWIDQDRKHTALKALQGMVWEDGYERGELKGPIYPDAVAAMKAWSAAGHSIHVYSSGSVLAQKLLLRHSTAGDLAPLVSSWFDTEIGGKREAGSYEHIADRVGRSPAAPLFLSDIVEELDAARSAGFATVLIDRLADHPRPRRGDELRGHRRAESLSDIHLQD